MASSTKSRQNEPGRFCDRCSAVCDHTCRVNAQLTGARDRVLRLGPRL